MDSHALVNCIQSSISSINAASIPEEKSVAVSPGTDSFMFPTTESTSSSSRLPASPRDGHADTACGSHAPTQNGATHMPAEDYVCPICHGLIFRPIRPSCQHIFCRFCLLLWVEKCAKNQHNSVCPMCRVDIAYPEMLPVDDKMEQQIISEVGLESYQLRHIDVVKEKIERVVVDSEMEHRNEIDENFYTTLQFGARAGILGTAFAGPVGAVAAIGIVGAYAAYMQVRRLKREDRRKFGLIEDDAAGWVKLPQNVIQVTNLSLTKVTVELYDQRSMFPLDFRSFEPHEIGMFTIVDATPGSGYEDQIYSLRITFPGFVEKELGGGPVAPGHGYLFCCTDACVEEAPIDEGKYSSSEATIEIKNDSLVTVKCAFYSYSVFSDEIVTIEPDETKLVTLPEEIYVSTVQISVASDSFFVADMELCNVQMRRRHAYRILESRIRNIDDEQKADYLEGDWMFGPVLPDNPNIHPGYA